MASTILNTATHKDDCNDCDESGTCIECTGGSAYSTSVNMIAWMKNGCGLLTEDDQGALHRRGGFCNWGFQKPDFGEAGEGHFYRVGVMGPGFYLGLCWLLYAGVGSGANQWEGHKFGGTTPDGIYVRTGGVCAQVLESVEVL